MLLKCKWCKYWNPMVLNPDQPYCTNIETDVSSDFGCIYGELDKSYPSDNYALNELFSAKVIDMTEYEEFVNSVIPFGIDLF